MQRYNILLKKQSSTSGLTRRENFNEKYTPKGVYLIILPIFVPEKVYIL